MNEYLRQLKHDLRSAAFPLGMLILLAAGLWIGLAQAEEYPDPEEDTVPGVNNPCVSEWECMTNTWHVAPVPLVVTLENTGPVCFKPDEPVPVAASVSPWPTVWGIQRLKDVRCGRPDKPGAKITIDVETEWTASGSALNEPVSGTNHSAIVFTPDQPGTVEVKLTARWEHSGCPVDSASVSTNLTIPIVDIALETDPWLGLQLKRDLEGVEERIGDPVTRTATAETSGEEPDEYEWVLDAKAEFSPEPSSSDTEATYAEIGEPSADIDDEEISVTGIWTWEESEGVTRTNTCTATAFFTIVKTEIDMPAFICGDNTNEDAMQEITLSITPSDEELPPDHQVKISGSSGLEGHIYFDAEGTQPVSFSESIAMSNFPSTVFLRTYVGENGGEPNGGDESGSGVDPGNGDEPAGGLEPGEYELMLEHVESEAKYSVEFVLLKVEFDTFEKEDTREIGGTRSPNWKPHKLNLDTRQKEEEYYGAYEKCVAHIWSEQPLNLAKYLNGYEEYQEFFENPEFLNWKVDGGLQESFYVNMGAKPEENKITKFEIEVVCKEDGTPFDFLIVTVIPPSTLANFEGWVDANQDLTWLEGLPAVYHKVELDDNEKAINPEPSSLTCDYWKNNAPFSMFFNMTIDSFYHPDAYHEIRSKEVAGGYGHQACYDKDGKLLRIGASAGSADKSFYGNTFGANSHVNVDVKPFVWAVQLDGTPAHGEFGMIEYRNIDHRIMHEGAFIGEYLILRPPIANNKPELAPGDCP